MQETLDQLLALKEGLPVTTDEKATTIPLAIAEFELLVEDIYKCALVQADLQEEANTFNANAQTVMNTLQARATNTDDMVQARFEVRKRKREH